MSDGEFGRNMVDERHGRRGVGQSRPHVRFDVDRGKREKGRGERVCYPFSCYWLRFLD